MERAFCAMRTSAWQARRPLTALNTTKVYAKARIALLLESGLIPDATVKRNANLILGIGKTASFWALWFPTKPSPSLPPPSSAARSLSFISILARHQFERYSSAPLFSGMRAL